MGSITASIKHKKLKIHDLWKTSIPKRKDGRLPLRVRREKCSANLCKKR